MALDDLDLSSIFDKNRDSIASFSSQIDDLHSNMMKMVKDAEGTDSAFEAMKNQIKSVAQALSAHKSAIDTSTAKGKAYAKMVSEMESELSALDGELKDSSNATLGLAKRIEDLGGKAKQSAGDFDKLSKDVEKYKEELLEARKASNQFAQGANIAAGGISNLAAQIQKYTSGSASAATKTTLFMGATMVLGNAMGSVAKSFREAVKELNDYQVQLEATSKVSLASPTGISGLEQLRAAVGTTRTEFKPFLSTLKETSKVGIDTSSLISAAQNVTKMFGEGSEAQAALKEYADLLIKMPSLAQDMSFSATADDKSAAIFALAEQGNVEVAIKAGLFGGIESGEGAKVQTDIQKSIKVQEDIRNEIKNIAKGFSEFVPGMTLVGEYSKLIVGALTTVLVPAVSLAASVAYKQRADIVAAIAKSELGQKGPSLTPSGGKPSGTAAAMPKGTGFIKNLGAQAKWAGAGLAKLSGGVALVGAAIGGVITIGKQIQTVVAEWDNLHKAVKDSSPLLQSFGHVVGSTTDKMKQFASAMESGTVIESQINQIDNAMGVMTGKVGGWGDSLGTAYAAMDTSIWKTVGAFTSSGAAIGATIGGAIAIATGGILTPAIALGGAIGGAVGAVIGFGTSIYQLASGTYELHQAIQEAAEAATKQQKEMATAFGYSEIDDFRKGLDSLNKEIKDAEKEMTGSAQQALFLQQSLKSLDAAAQSPIVRLHEFSAETAKSSIEMQRAIGGSTQAFFANARTINQSFGKVLVKRLQDTDRIMSKTFSNMNSKDPALFSMSLKKSEKIVADETKKFVSELENVIKSLSETPQMLAAQMKSEAAGAMFQVGEAMMTGISTESAVATFKVQSEANAAQMKEATKAAVESFKAAAEGVATLRKASEEGAKSADKAMESVSFEGLDKAIKEKLGGTKEEQKSTFEKLKTSSGRDELAKEDPGKLEALNALLKTSSDATNAALMTKKAELEALKQVQSILQGSVSGGIGSEEDIKFAAEEKKIAEEEKFLADLAAKDFKDVTGAENLRKATIESRAKSEAESTDPMEQKKVAARKRFKSDFSGQDQEGRDKILAGVEESVQLMEKTRVQVMDLLQEIPNMDFGDKDFNSQVKKYSKDVINKLLSGNMTMEQAQKAMAEIFKGREIPKAIQERVSAIVKENEEIKKKSSTQNAMIMATTNTINKNADMTKIQYTAMLKAQTIFAEKVAQGTKDMLNLIKFESNKVKAASAEVAVVKAFDVAGLGASLGLMGSRLSGDIKVMEETFKDTDTKLEKANEFAEIFAKEVASGTDADKIIADMEKASGPMAEDIKAKLKEQIESYGAGDITESELKAMFKNVNLEAAIKREYQKVGEVVKELSIDFSGTDIGKATQGAASSVDSMIELAKTGFVDIGAQAQIGLAWAKKAMQEEVNLQKTRVTKAEEALGKMDTKSANLKEKAAQEEDPEKKAAIEKEILIMEQARKGVVMNIQSLRLQAAQKEQAAIIEFEKRRLKLMFAGLEIEKRKSEISEEIASTQLSLLEQIGAPYASILEKQAQMVAESKKQAEVETQKYEEMQARLGDSVEVREQELKMVKANAKVAQQTIQAQRSAMEKLLGAAIGELGNIGGFKRNLLAQQKGTGLTVGPGGIVQGGAGSAKSKSQQAAAIGAASMVAGGMSKTTKTESKDIKEATDNATDSTDKNTTATEKNTESNEKVAESNERVAQSNADLLNAMLNNRAPLNTNVPIPQGKAGPAKQRGVGDQTSTGGSGKPTKGASSQTPPPGDVITDDVREQELKAGAGAVIKLPEAPVQASSADGLAKQEAVQRENEKKRAEANEKIAAGQMELLALDVSRAMSLDQMAKDAAEIDRLKKEQIASDAELRQEELKIDLKKEEAVGLAVQMGRLQDERKKNTEEIIAWDKAANATKAVRNTAVVAGAIVGTAALAVPALAAAGGAAGAAGGGAAGGTIGGAVGGISSIGGGAGATAAGTAYGTVTGTAIGTTIGTTAGTAAGTAAGIGVAGGVGAGVIAGGDAISDVGFFEADPFSDSVGDKKRRAAQEQELSGMRSGKEEVARQKQLLEESAQRKKDAARAARAQADTERQNRIKELELRKNQNSANISYVNKRSLEVSSEVGMVQRDMPMEHEVRQSRFDLEKKKKEEEAKRAVALDSEQFSGKIGPQEYASIEHLNQLGEESAAAFKSGEISFDQYTARQDMLDQSSPDKRTNEQILKDMKEDTRRMASGEGPVIRGSEVKSARAAKKRKALEERMKEKAKRQIAKEKGVINFADKASVSEAMKGVSEEDINARAKTLTDEHLAKQMSKQKAPATGVVADATATPLEDKTKPGAAKEVFTSAETASGVPGVEATGTKVIKSKEQQAIEEAQAREEATTPTTTEEKAKEKDKEKEDKAGETSEEQKKKEEEMKEREEKQLLAMQAIDEKMDKLNDLLALIKDTSKTTAESTQSMEKSGVQIKNA